MAQNSQEDSNSNPEKNLPFNNEGQGSDQAVEQAAEQLAILLWKTWLHKKNAKDRANKMKNGWRLLKHKKRSFLA